jgi:hypothetical protein
MALQSHIPFPQTWVVCEIVVKVLSLIITNYVINKIVVTSYLEIPYIVISTCCEICELSHHIVLNSLIDLEMFSFDEKLEEL